MRQNITPVSNEIFTVMEEHHQPGLKPGKQTLAFIRQFARVYHEEDKLPPSLRGMLLN
ncbi:MAG: hypothetical protein LBR64_06740 [Dysgonamonadaceae bacterium]|jgi:hypothetical protein|nr:hypothetical protein [Dysgonamonadaceae bacterium]